MAAKPVNGNCPLAWAACPCWRVACSQSLAPPDPPDEDGAPRATCSGATYCATAALPLSVGMPLPRGGASVLSSEARLQPELGPPWRLSFPSPQSAGLRAAVLSSSGGLQPGSLRSLG